jgi:uncharacterized membrane protein HdeD (DUF308 family)
MSNATCRQILYGTGVLIILLAGGAALLPLARELPAREVVGWLLLVAGVIELASLPARRMHRPSAAIAAGITAVAGLRLLLDSSANFFAVLNLVILWLIVRSAALGFAAWRARDALQSWLILAGAVDFLLAIGLLAGMPITYLVVGLFGPTAQIVGTFAWVLAISFVATGALLIAAARLEIGKGKDASPAI